MTVRKSLCERYFIRADHSAWALIYLNNEVGDITIQSDFGNYAYIWGSRGNNCTLKQFLIEAEKDLRYITEKFSYGQGGGQRHWLKDESINAVRTRIIEARREGLLTKELARSSWNSIKELVRYSYDLHAFAKALEEESSILEDMGEHLYDFMECYMRYDYEPGLRSFMTVIWPKFIQELKNEAIQEEALGL